MAPEQDAATPEEVAAAGRLIVAAKYAKDDEDEAAFARVWARDARLTIESNGRALPPIEGRAAILAFYRRAWAAGAHGTGEDREVHVAEAPHVTRLPGGRLLARHGAVFAAMPGAEPLLIGFATFRDELAFEDGNWRILNRCSIIKRRAKAGDAG